MDDPENQLKHLECKREVSSTNIYNEDNDERMGCLLNKSTKNQPTLTIKQSISNGSESIDCIKEQPEKIQTLIESLDEIELNSNNFTSNRHQSHSTNQKDDIEISYSDDDDDDDDSTHSSDDDTVLGQAELINQSESEKTQSEEVSIIQPETNKYEVIVTPKPRERKSKSSICSNNEMRIKAEQQSDSLKTLNRPEPKIRLSKSRQQMISSSYIDRDRSIDYPDDLNPFDDLDQPNDHGATMTLITIEYPDDLNPFCEDDNLQNVDVDGGKLSVNVESFKAHLTTSSLNPFGSESEDESFVNDGSMLNISNISFNRQKSLNNPSTTPIAKRKKRPAPLPPSINKSNQSLNQLTNDNDSNYAMDDSIISTTRSMNGSIDRSRTPTPKPRRSKICNNQSKSSCNLAESPSTISNSVQAQLKAIKNKKRPAPPRPAYKRQLKTSAKDLDDELNKLGDELPIVEKELSLLEQWLLKHQIERKTVADNNEESHKEFHSKTQEQPQDFNRKQYEDKLNRFLELAQQKCKLARKQKELMYMKRELKLEETQIELEYQLRVIMAKQDAQKTQQDRNEEQRLLNKMMEIIDERNDIIENMIQDENKEIEQYQHITAKVLPETNDNMHEMIPKSSSSHSKHHFKQPFLKIKKINKKIKTKIKPKQHTDGTDHADDNDYDNNTLKVDNLETASPSQKTETVAVSSTSKSKKKDLTTLGRSTLKKLSHPTKTFHSVTNEFKSRLQQSSNNEP